MGFWLASLGTLGAYFTSRSTPLPRVATGDVLIAAAVPGRVLAPLYLLGLGAWPVQVGLDEVAVMVSAKHYAATGGMDLFGLSDFLGIHAGLLVLWGEFGGLLGGVELGAMRLIHGVCGLLVIAASYALFRQLMPRGWALAATVLVRASATRYS